MRRQLLLLATLAACAPKGDDARQPDTAADSAAATVPPAPAPVVVDSTPKVDSSGTPSPASPAANPKPAATRTPGAPRPPAMKPPAKAPGGSILLPPPTESLRAIPAGQKP